MARGPSAVKPAAHTKASHGGCDGGHFRGHDLHPASGTLPAMMPEPGAVGIVQLPLSKLSISPHSALLLCFPSPGSMSSPGSLP